MPIEMFCSGCGKKMRAPDSSKGCQVCCPRCQAISEVPMPAGETYYPPVESYYQPAPPQPSAYGDLGSLMDEAAGYDYSMSINLPPVPPPVSTPLRAPRATVKKKRRRTEDTELSGSETLLSVCVLGFGFIMALIFLLQGKPAKAGKIFAIAFVVHLLSAISWVMLFAMHRAGR